MLHPSLESVDGASKETGRHTVRITLKELHLTKNTERITKEAYNLSVKFKINDITCESRIIEHPSQHIAWTEELKATLGREDDSAEILLLAHQGTDVTELGFATLDLEPLVKLKKFGGSVQLSYRCTKSATLVCELSVAQGLVPESNYITLGSNTQSSVLHLLPTKEYPIPNNSRLRTPQFTSRNFATSSSADHATYPEHDSRALIARIKDQKTPIDELLEVLNDERPEVIYYACLRLQFFASQTNYSRLMLDRSWIRLTELMTLMCRDQWVSLQLLWVVFRLLDHMPEVRDRQTQRLEEAGAIAVAAVLKIWKELLSNEVTSLAIEVTVRLVPDGAQKNRLNSLCQNFNLITLLFDTLSKYRSTQIVSPTLILICEILDIPNKYEYWELLRRGGIISYITTFFTQHNLNNEVMITSIKTLQSLSAIVYFRVSVTQEEIALQVKFELLSRVQQRYPEDVYKAKFIVAIIRDLTGTQTKSRQTDQLLVATEVLEEIMKRHLDTSGILELALTALKSALAQKDAAVIRKLSSIQMLDLLMDVLARHHNDAKVLSLCVSLINSLKVGNDPVLVRDT